MQVWLWTLLPHEPVAGIMAVYTSSLIAILDPKCTRIAIRSAPSKFAEQPFQHVTMGAGLGVGSQDAKQA